jgi:hypothetical protein
MIIPASAKLFGWAFVGVSGLAVAGWLNARLVRSTVRDELKIAGFDTSRKKLDSARVAHDSGYRVDTILLRSASNAYQPLRAAARKTPSDTTAARKALDAADTAIKACVAVIASCEQRVKDRDAIIANRDSLVRELRKPIPIPRLSYDVAGMYDPFRRESVLRSGVEFRAFFDFRGRVEAEYSDVNGFGARVGIRKVF